MSSDLRSRGNSSPKANVETRIDDRRSRQGGPPNPSRNYSRDSRDSREPRDAYRPLSRDSFGGPPPRSKDYPRGGDNNNNKGRGRSPPPYSTNGDKYGSNSKQNYGRPEKGENFGKLQSPDKRMSSGSVKQRARWGSRSVELFEKLEQIGEGTYGKVYMARNRETGEIVALKKVRMANEKEGFPITAIREIKILKELHHENVVQLKEIVTSKATKENQGKAGIYMVFEYMDHDLTGLMLNEGKHWKPSQAQIKCYMKQLLEGLHYCHMNNVLHRDIKGSNLLMDNSGHLKLADFGLARPFTDQQNNNYTNRVITLWYRPPELLLGSTQYGPAIDMWSAGCILTELLTGRAIFPGKNEVDQLELIFKLCGTPTEQNWPDVDKLPWWHMFKPQKEIKRTLAEYLSKAQTGIPREALDLVDRLLTLDPKKRMTAAQALDSDYFWTEPGPALASDLPKYQSSHEFQAKKRKQQQQSGPTSLPPDAKRQKGPQGTAVPNGPPPPAQTYPNFSQGTHVPPSSAPMPYGHPTQQPARPRDTYPPPQRMMYPTQKPSGNNYPNDGRGPPRQPQQQPPYPPQGSVRPPGGPQQPPQQQPPRPPHPGRAP